VLNRNCTMLLRAQLNLFTVHLCTCAKLQTIYLGHVFIWCQENGRTMNKCTKSNVFLFLTLFSECKKILSVPRRRKRQSANVNKDRLRRCLDGWLKVFLYSICNCNKRLFSYLTPAFPFFSSRSRKASWFIYFRSRQLPAKPLQCCEQCWMRRQVWLFRLHLPTWIFWEKMRNK